MRNLTDLLVHFLRKSTSLNHVYLSMPRDHCLVCEENVGESPSYMHYRVCPTCRFHYSLTARERIELLVDRGSFREINRSIASLEPLTFSSRSSGDSRVSQDQKRTGLTEAVVTGHCTLGENKAMVIVLDFGFMGGTMGSVVGEKVALALENAAKGGQPVVSIVTGGGTRFQEGILSLMQMAKTVTAVQRLREKELPFIVVLANPATGQAYASFANLADIILAEPGALIGLAPMRTLREATKKPIPLDAHTAEAHLHHGLLDNVVDRENLKGNVVTLLNILGPQRSSRADDNVKKIKLLASVNAEIGVLEAEQAVRRSDRPTARDYIRSMVDHFVELKGDRVSGDGRTVAGGLGFLRGHRVAVLGQLRDGQGSDGSYHTYPQGFRKAQRLIALATRFKLPLVTFIDTQGAHPGLESEEQGIGNAIATTMSLMADAPIPIISAIVGEGGSEGALALGLADTILIQEYSVVSPVSFPGTSSRLHRDPVKAREAAQALMLTAQESKELGIVNQVVPEPEGGAHRDPLEAAHYLQLAIAQELIRLDKLSPKKLVEKRQKKFRRMGELSAYAKEALGREVSQLQHMVAREQASKLPRTATKKSSEDTERAAD